MKPEVKKSSDAATNKYLMISNNGKLIESTNYWTSDYARNGKCYFSVNAGCVRLLLPGPSFFPSDDDVLAATEYVIISRGAFLGRDGYEVLFEDNSATPYVIHTLANQWDRAIPVAESGRTDVGFDVYTNGHLVQEITARFRSVNRLPYLKPWDVRRPRFRAYDRGVNNRKGTQR